MDISERLRARRVERGDSMPGAADACGVSYTAWRSWEKAATKPSFGQLRAIAKYCGVSVGVILEDLGVLDAAQTQALVLFETPAVSTRPANVRNAQRKPVSVKQRKASGNDGTMPTYRHSRVDQQERVAASA